MHPLAWLTGKRRLLRAGNWVVVKSAEEILGTLDARGRLDALPYMPEMLQFSGQRFRVYKSAHKTCDTIKTFTARRMTAAVHLEGLRCDGSGHGGCQAKCLLFWKTAWLTPLDGATVDRAGAAAQPAAGSRPAPAAVPDRLRRAACQTAGPTGAEETIYSCQATALLDATRPLRWWDPRQYVWDLAAGNIGFGAFIRHVGRAALNILIRLRRHDASYPNVGGLARGPVPAPALDLQPGELVQVRSREEIMHTLGRNRKNRGLWFDIEMEPFCGGRYKVLDRVKRLIDEKTGKMITVAGDCLILDGVSCSGCLSKDRLFCPRSIYPYWREIWLRRALPAPPE